MNSLEKAKNLIQQGELVAFPTETVYGLGADAFNESAIAEIYEAKGRPSSNPLIVHIADLSQLSLLTNQVRPEEKALITAFWPGPLTLIFPKKEAVPSATTGGLETVAVRMPAHPMALELIRLAGTPIAAPSANPSGKPSATHHEHVQSYFGDALLTLEGGATQHGLESTVLQVKNGTPHLYCLGSITPEDIEQVLGKAPILETHSEHSPGTRFRHYSPQAPVELLSPKELIEHAHQATEPIGVLATEAILAQVPQAIAHFNLGKEGDYPTIGSRIYSGLITLDTLHLNKIFIQSFPETGLGQTIMDRLRRASGQME